MNATGLTRSDSLPADWLKHGLIGGIIAGIVFAAFEMIVAAILDGPSAFFMPLRMIGGIALGEQALDPGFSLAAAGVAGLVVHMVLSAVYGAGVAGVARYVPVLASSAIALIVWASVAGLGLWLVNFYVIAPIGGWTWFPDGTNAVVQFVAHTFFYGTVLGIYLNAVARRSRTQVTTTG
jgi:tetrahydromethanopterin S-methyltransferase subunit F